MRELLETRYAGRRLYVFTTMGRVHVGQVGEILDDVVELVSADGTTRVHLNLSDISGLRLHDDEPAVVE